jgi:hypothetical protein
MSDFLLGSNVFFDGADFAKMLGRLAVDLAFMLIVVFGVYWRLYRNREHIFTLFVFNLITFSMCILLRKVPVDMGFALGLFAVFGILRFRTEPVRTKDLTYMFIVIGLGIINGIANKSISGVELLSVNAIIAGATMIVELAKRDRTERSVPMLYDNLPLLHASRTAELLEDMTRRTGLTVTRVELVRIDLVRDAAEVVVFYAHQPGQIEQSSRLGPD